MQRSKDPEMISRISKPRWLVFFFLPKTFSTTFFSQHFQSSKHSTVIKRKNRLILCAKIQVQNVCCCQFWKERILLKSDSLSYRLNVAAMATNNMTKQTNITVECVIEACYVDFPATTIPPYVDTTLWMSLVLVCLVGVPVNLFIIFYDLYGGDPNKRSLGNQILSIASFANNVATFCCFMIAILFRYR